MKRLLLLLVFMLATVAGFAQADVVVTNTNNQNLYVAGTSVVYTVTVKNNGPEVATGVQVTYTNLNAIGGGGASSSWSGNGSSGTNPTFDNAIFVNTIPTLAVGETVVYTVTVNLPAWVVGALQTVANVTTTSTDPNTTNNQASDSDLQATTGADVVVTNTDNEVYYFTGSSSLYVITVKNNGPQVAQNIHFMNAKPSGVEIATWYSSRNNGAGTITTGASGSGNISNEVAELAVGASITYYFTVNVPNVYVGTLASIANVTTTSNDPIPENNTNITDFNVKAVNADVKISITNNQTIYTPGGNTSYTVVVKNDGPLAAANVNVASVFPAGITPTNWSGTNASTGTGELVNVIASLPSGSSVTYTVNVQIPGTFTGDLAAQVSATSTTADPNLTNNTATDTDAQISGANIVVTNTNGQTTYAVGTTTEYTITVTNQGPQVATNVNVFNAMPNGVTAATWSGNNSSAGTGNLQDVIPTLAVGASVIYTFNVDIPSNYLGNLKSETVISGPTFDPFPTCTNCIDIDTPSVTTNANVAVTITDGQSSYVANQTLTYTATVVNNGPSVANDVHVVVPVPTGITNFTWTGTNGSSGTNVGLNNTIPTLANGQSVTYTIVILVPPGFTGNLVNQISATSATNDPVLANNSAIDMDTPALTGADIKVVNTNNTNYFVPGANSTYIVTVTNQGPQTAYLVTPNVTFSPGVTLVSWSGSNGSTGTTLPVTNTIPEMSVGQVVTYTIIVNIPAGQTANVVSTATATLQTPSDPNFPNPSVDTDVLVQSDIAVTNTTVSDGYTLGQDIVYTVTVTNNGPNPATNVVVENLIPAGITDFSWTGPNSSSGTNVPVNNTIPTLASGASETYTITIEVPATFTGNLVTTANTTVSAGDTVPANNQATVTTPWGQYDISVTNTNGQTVYTPGAISNYTVTVTNNGPNPATNVVVQNLIPAGITSFSWTGPNASFGNDVALNHTIPTLAIGESVVYNITLTVPAGFTGDLVSEASAAIAGDLNLSNNTAIDKDVEAIISDVAIAITDNKTEYSPGISATYTVTVTNIGTVDASNIPVSSIVPADVTNYTWSGNGATGTGALNNTILSLAGGAFVTYTISFYVPATFTGNLVNEVSIVNPDTDASNNTSIDTNVPSAGANLVVVNTDSQPSYVPGQSRTYTIQITNYGPQVAQNVVVQNPVPAGINASTVSWSGNATSGTGALQNTIPTLAVGQTVTYTFVVPVPSNFPQNVNLVSEVTVTSDTIDPNPGCTQCVDVDTPTPFADLAVTKSDNRDTFLLSNNNTTPPEVEYVTYLITVVNNGPSDAMNVVVQDPMPNGINNVASVVWDASNGTNGTGSINQTIPTLTAGQIITYTVSIRMPTSFNSFTGNLVNVVNVSSSTPDNVSNNNSATDIDFPSTNHITIEAGKHNAALPVFNVKQLIRDILINEPCVNISNFTSSANSAQYGYFHRGNTNFPIKEGIILTSGNINTLDSKYTTGSSKQWGNYTPDPDLQMVMTAGGQTNQNRDASFVKFDFVPMGSEFSFNFLFSSQEYGQWQCSGFYDSFAFILTNLEDDTWENLAVVPVTGDMISVTKIRKGIYNNNCGDLNPTYFDKYNAGDGAGGSNQSNVEASHINIKGQTIRMKAATTVIAGKPYSIKLVVADASDDQLDTAVFIEAGSFNIGGPKITGTDLYADDEDFSGSNAICEGTTRIIRAATEANSDINYVWYRDDVIIPGANQHFIEVSEPGVYKVVFNYITMNCSQSDFIVVEFAPSPFDVDEAEDLYICDATPLFDLTQNKAIVLADFVQEDFTAQYYHSKEDAELGINRIGSETPPVSLTQYPGVDGETIYIKVINDFSGGYCDPIKPFQLFLTSSPSGGFSYPDDGGDPGFCIGSSTSLLPIAPGLTPGGVYTSTPPGLTIVDPATGEINVSTSLEGTYTVIYTFTGMGCPEYTSPPVQVIISPCIATIAANSGPVCEGTATFNLTATDAGAGATYEWKDYNGNVISNVQNPTGIPVPATDGTYPYSVVATVGTSVSAPSITTLIVHPTPEADFVTPASNSICTGGQATIEVTGTPNSTVNVAVVDATSNYSAAVVLNSTGIGIFGISGVTEDTTFSLVNIVTNTTPACEFIFSPSPSVVFTVGLPTATMVGFDDPVICLGTTGSFKIQGTPGATVTYTIDTANPTDVLLPPSGEFDVVTAIQNVAGTYTYELTNIETTGTAGCSNAISGQTAILTVNALPTASFSTTTPTVCQNTPATINFTGPQGATVTYTDQTGTNYSVPLDASGSYVLTTDNLPDPQQSYTFTLVSVEETSSGVTCSSPLTGSLTIEVDEDPVFVSITPTPTSPHVLCVGATIDLEVVATGANLSYQWYKDGTPAIPVGTDSETFTISNAVPTDAGFYYVEISGSCGTAVTSPMVELQLNQPIVIVDESTGGTFCQGEPINLFVDATGVALNYQWYWGTTPVGTNNPILNITATTANAGTYRCVITNSCPGQETTQDMVVVVNELPAITGQPNTPAPLCVGGSFTMTVTATGTGLSYQWYNGTSPVGTNSPTLNITSATLANAGDYTVVVSGACSPPVPSNIATVIVNEGPTITQQTQVSPSDTVCSGTTITLSIATTGGTNVSYQWKKGNANVPGANSPSLTINSAQVSDTGIYTCVISSDSCDPIISDALTITVNQAPTITDPVSPSSVNICEGQTRHLTVQATGTNLAYQWYRDGAVLPGAVTNVYTITSATLADSGDYHCVVSSLPCTPVPSPIISVTVRALPVATISIGGTSPICSGESSSITFQGTPGAVVTYNIAGVLNNETAQIDPSGYAYASTGTLTETTVYELVSVTYTGVDACSQPLTGSVTVEVNELPQVSIEDGYICIDPITLAVTRTYVLDTGLNDGQYTFEWSDANGVIPTATSSFYEASAVGQYSVTITDIVTECQQTAFATVYQSSPPISFDYTVNDYFSQNPTVTITAQPAGDYEYQLDYGPFQDSNVFDNISQGTHTITVRDPQACDVLTGEVTIIDYPKYFTPNGDGIHDTWNISEFGEELNAKIYIFDRFGKLVKEISTKGLGWDGTFNGQLLPATDYWFTLDYEEKGIRKEFKAHFSLKR